MAPLLILMGILDLIKSFSQNLNLKSKDIGHTVWLKNNINEIRRDYSFILERFIQSKSINLRALFKHYNNLILISNKNVVFGEYQSYINFHFPIIILIETLINIFGDLATLEQAVDESYNSKYENSNSGDYMNILQSCLTVIDYKHHKFANGLDFNLEFSMDNFIIKYLISGSKSMVPGQCIIEGILPNINNGGPDIMKALSASIKTLKDIRYF